MFNVCYECDGALKGEKGIVYGYWGDVEIKFIGLPRFQCSNCDEFYLDEKIAILTQEITRALSDINDVPEIVDISDSYEVLLECLEEVYDLITCKKIHLVRLNNKFIINSKDVRSLFCNNGILIAARNNCKITKDVEKEIEILSKENRKKVNL